MSYETSSDTRQKYATSARRSRRRFLASAAGVLAAPHFVPGSVLGMNGRVPANDRIRTGHIGLGGRGSGLAGAFIGDPATQVMAMCDPFQSKRERAQQRANARYAEDIGQGTYKGCDAIATSATWSRATTSTLSRSPCPSSGMPCTWYSQGLPKRI